jgi:hypothetical protein
MGTNVVDIFDPLSPRAPAGRRRLRAALRAAACHPLLVKSFASGGDKKASAPKQLLPPER